MENVHTEWRRHHLLPWHHLEKINVTWSNIRPVVPTLVPPVRVFSSSTHRISSCFIGPGPDVSTSTKAWAPTAERWPGGGVDPTPGVGRRMWTRSANSTRSERSMTQRLHVWHIPFWGSSRAEPPGWVIGGFIYGARRVQSYRS